MSITAAPVPPGGESGSARNSGGTAFPPPRRPSRVPLLLALLAIAGIIGVAIYGNYRLNLLKNALDSDLALQGKTLQTLSQQLEKTNARTDNLQGAMTVTQSRLGMTQAELQRAHKIAADLAQEQKQSAQQLSSQLGQLRQEQESTKGAVGSLSTDVTGVKGEVQTTKKELADTQSRLQSVIGDLGVQSGLIAHNKSELAELRLRGERTYIEFDLKKARRPRRFGPIELRLKKADTKHQKYTLTLIADDRKIEKKDKTVAEPVQFYQRGYRLPSEIVVNQIYKNRIVGYISIPKTKTTRTPMKAG